MRTEAEFVELAEDAIEAWAVAHENAWKDLVWIEKKPQSDGDYTKSGWRSAASTIVAEFNQRITPLSIVVTGAERDAFRDKKLKEFRSFLAQKAVAAQASAKAMEIMS